MSPKYARVLTDLHRRTLGATVEGWDETVFGTLLKNSAVVITTISSTRCLDVEEDVEPIVGFILSLKAKPEADLLTIVIAPEYQRFGLGEALIKAQKGLLKDEGIHTWHLEVHEQNLSAIAFYKKMGFDISGRRPNYYPAWSGQALPRAAALVMSCAIE